MDEAIAADVAYAQRFISTDCVLAQLRASGELGADDAAAEADLRARLEKLNVPLRHTFTGMHALDSDEEEEADAPAAAGADAAARAPRHPRKTVPSTDELGAAAAARDASRASRGPADQHADRAGTPGFRVRAERSRPRADTRHQANFPRAPRSPAGARGPPVVPAAGLPA